MEDVLGKWQHGFRPGRSTLELIFTMKMILEKTWEWGLQKFILFIDFEKAFDRVQRNDLWSVLANNRYKIPLKLRRVIRNAYSQCLSKVQGRDGSSDWFSITSGVRQEDVLSPLLFIIYMDAGVREAREGEDGVCETLAYADYIAVETSDVGLLQLIVDR